MAERNARVFGRLLLTTCMQAEGAPLIDRCTTRDNGDGRWARGIAVLLTPWRRNRYGEASPQVALVIAWKEAPRG